MCNGANIYPLVRTGGLVGLGARALGICITIVGAAPCKSRCVMALGGMPGSTKSGACITHARTNACTLSFTNVCAPRNADAHDAKAPQARTQAPMRVLQHACEHTSKHKTHARSNGGRVASSAQHHHGDGHHLGAGVRVDSRKECAVVPGFVKLRLLFD